MPAAAGGPGRRQRCHRRAQEDRTTTSRRHRRPSPNRRTFRSYSLHVDVPVVTIDAHILPKTGCRWHLPVEMASEHFKVWEDGVPQKIQSVTVSKAPITAVLLVEFAATNYTFMYDALNCVVHVRFQPAAAGLGGGGRVRYEDAHPGGLYPGQADHLRRA